MTYDHEHQWEPWWTTADQLDLISPDKEGNIWRYHSRCNIMGCRAVRFAEKLTVVGKEKIELNDVP